MSRIRREKLLSFFFYSEVYSSFLPREMVADFPVYKNQEKRRERKKKLEFR